MSRIVKGVFLSDIHMSDSNPRRTETIDLCGVLNYVSDFQPDTIILGGDIIDAKNMHGIESFAPQQFKMAWYRRDCRFLNRLMTDLEKAAPKANYVYLEGNHEERYTRLAQKYPDLFSGLFNWVRDGVPAPLQSRVKFIPYGTYRSYYKLGDCMFIHGDVYPDQHAKKYGQAYLPSKVWYGHLHDAQIYSTSVAGPRMPARYAGTAGCLSKRAPEWKKGVANRWVNGFADFICIDGITTITPHFIERGVFQVGGKLYVAKGPGY